MHHPTDGIGHTLTFGTSVVEHWLEREIAQWAKKIKSAFLDRFETDILIFYKFSDIHIELKPILLEAGPAVQRMKEEGIKCFKYCLVAVDCRGNSPGGLVFLLYDGSVHIIQRYNTGYHIVLYQLWNTDCKKYICLAY